MTEDNDDFDLDEYVSGANKKKGATAAIIILTLLFLGAAGAAGFFGWKWSEGQKFALQHNQELETLNGSIRQLEQKNSDLSSQLMDKQAEVERTREESKTQIAALELRHREQVQKTYLQVDEIVNDSRKTLEYIGTIEDKMKAGKALDEAEAQQLQGVVAGLTFLHQQYEKPIHEFRELERFLAEQIAVPASVPPKERYGLAKRIFKNKQFKAEQATFYRDQGQREAFERARTKVTQAYASAQSQMRALKVDSHQFLNQLDAIVASNEQSAADIDEFFSKSKEILKIHDKIMNLEPETGLTIPVQP